MEGLAFGDVGRLIAALSELEKLQGPLGAKLFPVAASMWAGFTMLAFWQAYRDGGGEEEFLQVLLRALVSLLALELYQPMITAMRELFVQLGSIFNTNERFRELLSIIRADLAEGKLHWRVMSLELLDFLAGIVVFSSLFLLIFSFVGLHIAQGYGLVFLNVFGPLYLALYPSRQLAGSTWRWFRALLAVSAYPVVWSLLFSMLGTLVTTYYRLAGGEEAGLSLLVATVIIFNSLVALAVPPLAVYWMSGQAQSLGLYLSQSFRAAIERASSFMLGISAPTSPGQPAAAPPERVPPATRPLRSALFLDQQSLSLPVRKPWPAGIAALAAGGRSAAHLVSAFYELAATVKGHALLEEFAERMARGESLARAASLFHGLPEGARLARAIALLRADEIERIGVALQAFFGAGPGRRLADQAGDPAASIDHTEGAARAFGLALKV